MTEGWRDLAQVAGGVLVLGLLLRGLARRRRRTRRPDLAAFLRRCEAQGTPPDVATQVFHALQEWRSDEGARFAVRADDRLERVYGIGADEIDATVALLARRLGRRAEPGRKRPALATAADLAHAVASCLPDPAARPEEVDA
ncbi:MAG TPA: hypothetical protein VMS55_14120 [Myxococcota bacterium]|nr:hypothetical protein [Myxococcota bacterium]